MQAEKRLDALGKNNQDVQRLQAIGGVGPRTAEVVRCWAMLRDGTDWREDSGAPGGVNPPTQVEALPA